MFCRNLPCHLNPLVWFLPSREAESKLALPPMGHPFRYLRLAIRSFVIQCLTEVAEQVQGATDYGALFPEGNNSCNCPKVHRCFFFRLKGSANNTVGSVPLLIRFLSRAAAPLLLSQREALPRNRSGGQVKQ
ncbi:Hypothetical predicted protein [Podarcis lilfordi]|uniref:Uncharacterized protein n=1 Tax=Podarcis lilfordi TaxID=74358 RepID=A0AA35JUC9_9SAUR|nr:Hypothetical predicted protein [Podarcis lilfordi]